MLTTYVQLATAVHYQLHRWRAREERGQASAEYALVLLGAAAIALLVAGWAAKTGLVGNLLDTVLGKITRNAGSNKP